MGRLWGNNGHGMAPQSSPSSSFAAAAAAAAPESCGAQGGELLSSSAQISTTTTKGNVDPVMPDVEAQLPHEQPTQAQLGREEDTHKVTTMVCTKDNLNDDISNSQNIIKHKAKKPHLQNDADTPNQDPTDIIISSIQALPSPSAAPSSLGSNAFGGQVGAHHVSTGITAPQPRRVAVDREDASVGINPPHHPRCSVDDDDEQTMTSLTIGLESMESGFVSSLLTTHTLVEAHLVTSAKDDEAGSTNNPTPPAPEEVYQAEKISITATLAASSRRTKSLLAAAVLVVCVLVGTVVALALNQDNDKEYTGTTSPEAADSAGQAVEEMKNGTIEDQEEGSHCFESHDDLYDAITAYYEDPTPNSSIAKQCGYPIGTWCVSELRNFNDILTPYRNETNVNFSEEAKRFACYLQQEDIGQWDLSNARTMEGMFQGIRNLSVASLGIDRWDVSNARNLNELFKDTQWQDSAEEADNYSPQSSLDLSSWNTSSVKTMAKLFQYSTVERGTGIGSWDTSQVESLNSIAEGATHFNEDVGRWNTQSVTSMQSTFKDASNFNQDISQWKTSSLNKLNMAFLNAAKFNQPIGIWDTSKVRTLRATFQSTRFNQDLSTWDVTKVKVMKGTFRYSSFNQDLGRWNVSAVEDLRWMFESAINFSQNLCSWGSLLPPNAKVDGMFKHTSCPNTSDPMGPEGPFCFNCH